MSRRVFSLLLLLFVACLACEHAAGVAPHGLEGAVRPPPAAVPAAAPATAHPTQASVKDLMEHPMSEDAARVEKKPIQDSTAKSAGASASSSPPPSAATRLAEWLRKRAEHKSKPKPHVHPHHHAQGQPKHRYGHREHEHNPIGRLHEKKERKVHPTPAPPKSVEPAQQQPAASPETEFKLRSALDRIVARVRSIFQSERDQVQQAAKELNDVNEKLNAELADKAKAMQHEAEAAKDRASVSGSTAAKIEPTPAKSEPAKTVPRPMHVLLKPEVNPPIAVALSVTDIIIIVVVVVVVLFCCGGFGYSRYSSGPVI